MPLIGVLCPFCQTAKVPIKIFVFLKGWWSLKFISDKSYTLSVFGCVLYNITVVSCNPII